MVKAICALNTKRLEEVYALLQELDDSEMLTRIGGELEVNIGDMLEAVSAFIGAVRIEAEEVN